jgi:hypothetical protein
MAAMLVFESHFSIPLEQLEPNTTTPMVSPPSFQEGFGIVFLEAIVAAASHCGDACRGSPAQRVTCKTGVVRAVSLIAQIDTDPAREPQEAVSQHLW